MLDLVIWTFVLALIPLALGLAWSLISGVAESIRVRQTRSHEASKRTNLSHSLLPKA
jgi:hypothetical protein